MVDDQGPDNRVSPGSPKLAIKNIDYEDSEFTNPPDTDRPKRTRKQSTTPKKMPKVHPTSPLVNEMGLKDQWNTFLNKSCKYNELDPNLLHWTKSVGSLAQHLDSNTKDRCPSNDTMSSNKLFVMKEPVFLKHHTSRQRELDLVKAHPNDYQVYTDIEFIRVPKSPPLKQSDQQKKQSKYKDALWAMKTSRIKGKLKTIQDKLSIKITEGKIPARRNSNTVWKKIVAKSLSRSNSPYWNNSQVP